MPVSIHRESRSVWFEKTVEVGGAGFPICTFWEDGEVILEGSEGHEYIYPTLEEWEYLAKIVKTNIKRLRKENSGD